MDAENVVIGIIRENLSVNAYHDAPSVRELPFVTVLRTGGSFSEQVSDAPMLDVKCWAATRAEAAELAGDVKTVLPLLMEEPDVFGYSVASEYRDEDMDSGTPRQSLVVELRTNI